jgi:hypothetical protein
MQSSMLRGNGARRATRSSVGIFGKSIGGFGKSLGARST